MSGAFLGSFNNTVNADQFQFYFSILILGMVILGGLGSIWGVVLGAIVLTFINFYLIPDVFNSIPGKLGLDFDMTQITFAIYGFLLVIMMIMRPEGLLPERRRKQELHDESEDALVDAGTVSEDMTSTRDHADGEPRQPTARSSLDAQHVTKQFGGLTAVSDVTFSVPERSIVSIIGPNGAGKTTFFNMLTGFYKPTHGQDRASTSATSRAAART